jgi:hypothetical protein
LNGQCKAPALADASAAHRYGDGARSRRSDRPAATTATVSSSASATDSAQAYAGEQYDCAEDALPSAPCPQQAAKAEQKKGQQGLVPEPSSVLQLARRLKS